MRIERVKAANLRCFATLDWSPGPGANLVIGENGCGKTTLAEALFVLSRGRSFRHASATPLLRHGSDSWWCSARWSDGNQQRHVGVGYESGATRARLDGQVDVPLRTLAAELPIMVVEPDAHRLIDDGPNRRRRFLDWGLFHVEPSYLETWQRFHQALRQRNAALRQGSRPDPWNRAFLEAALRVDADRRRYVDALQTELTTASAESGTSHALRYQPGWAGRGGLDEALHRTASGEQVQKTTLVGPQRADFSIYRSGRKAPMHASRGEQKETLLWLSLAQARHLMAGMGRQPLVIVDDLAAELGPAAYERVRTGLLGLVKDGCQLVVTALERPGTAWPPTSRMFHVEQGPDGSVVTVV